jgi:two-component system sensor histidine kinase MprB
MTLRQKFVVAFAAVAVLVAALVGTFSYIVTEHNLRAEVDFSLVAAATNLSAGPPPANTGSNTEDNGAGRGASGIIQTARIIEGDGSARQILGADVGIPVSESAAALAAPDAVASSRLYESVTESGTSYRVLTEPLPDGQGAIQVARDLSETSRILSNLAVTTILVGLAVLFLAAGTGWLIARQITRRLTALTEVAERVSSTGHLDVEITAHGQDEVGRLSASLETMLAELARSRDDQQRLLQNAGHELRTPLTSLRTNVSVLRRFDELSPTSRRRLLDDVDGETRELTHLVNELVELATDRRDAEQVVPVDLAQLAERTAERYRRRSGRVIIVAAETCTVQARPHAIERALSNLLDNAVKFDPLGSAPIEVRVHDGRVEVLDRGPGLDSEDESRVFDRFYRSATARSMPGSGLGLSIVRDVAAEHGGTVTAAARPGGGAVIGFTVISASVAGSPELLPESKPHAARR